MADLKTDYKDDILDTSQNTKRKYQMIDNGDGTVSFEDVTEYLQQGDSFGADDINDTNEKINIINDNLSGQDYVELITSGQTYSSAIDTLFSMINKNKIQPGKSCLRFNSAVLHVVDYSDVQIIASRTYVNYLNKLVTDSFTFYVNNSKFVNKTDNDIFDNSSRATTGATLRFIY